MNLKIKIDRKHFRKDLGFTLPQYCPLAEALKEIFPAIKIYVGPDNVSIDNHIIKFKGWSESWTDFSVMEKISNYIDNPNDPNFELFEVELLDVPEYLSLTKKEILS